MPIELIMFTILAASGVAAAAPFAKQRHDAAKAEREAAELAERQRQEEAAERERQERAREVAEAEQARLAKEAEERQRVLDEPALAAAEVVLASADSLIALRGEESAAQAEADRLGSEASVKKDAVTRAEDGVPETLRTPGVPRAFLLLAAIAAVPITGALVVLDFLAFRATSELSTALFEAPFVVAMLIACGWVIAYGAGLHGKAENRSGLRHVSLAVGLGFYAVVMIWMFSIAPARAHHAAQQQVTAANSTLAKANQKYENDEQQTAPEQTLADDRTAIAKAKAGVDEAQSFERSATSNDHVFALLVSIFEPALSEAAVLALPLLEVRTRRLEAALATRRHNNAKDAVAAAHTMLLRAINQVGGATVRRLTDNDVPDALVRAQEGLVLARNQSAIAEEIFASSDPLNEPAAAGAGAEQPTVVPGGEPAAVGPAQEPSPQREPVDDEPVDDEPVDDEPVDDEPIDHEPPSYDVRSLDDLNLV